MLSISLCMRSKVAYMNTGFTIQVESGDVVSTWRGPLLDMRLPLTRGGGVATEPED